MLFDFDFPGLPGRYMLDLRSVFVGTYAYPIFFLGLQTFYLIGCLGLFSVFGSGYSLKTVQTVLYFDTLDLLFVLFAYLLPLYSDSFLRCLKF